MRLSDKQIDLIQESFASLGHIHDETARYFYARLFELAPDFVTPANSTFQLAATIPVSPSSTASASSATIHSRVISQARSACWCLGRSSERASASSRRGRTRRRTRCTSSFPVSGRSSGRSSSVAASSTAAGKQE